MNVYNCHLSRFWLKFQKFVTVISCGFNHNSPGATLGATLVKKIEHIRIRTVFVIGPQDTTQNSVFDEGKLPM